VIGGRVLDSSAVRAFVEQRSVYVSALVWTATEEDIVLLIPASVLAEVRAEAGDAERAVLDVLLGLPITVVDPLDARRSREAADLLGPGGTDDLASAQAAACALARGWPLVSAQPSRFVGVVGLAVEELPSTGAGCRQRPSGSSGSARTRR
jgi:predicted nucleic acid-binding protein